MDSSPQPGTEGGRKPSGVPDIGETTGVGTGYEYSWHGCSVAVQGLAFIVDANPSLGKRDTGLDRNGVERRSAAPVEVRRSWYRQPVI
jgi:hypothetical protein